MSRTPSRNVYSQRITSGSGNYSEMTIGVSQTGTNIMTVTFSGSSQTNNGTADYAEANFSVYANGSLVNTLYFFNDTDNNTSVNWSIVTPALTSSIQIIANYEASFNGFSENTNPSVNTTFSYRTLADKNITHIVVASSMSSLPSSPVANIYFIKNIRTDSSVLLISSSGKTIDGSSNSLTIPAKGGITLAYNGNWHILTYYEGTLPTSSSAASFTISDTYSLASVNITSGSKVVNLPSALSGKILVVSAYTTGTSTTNTLTLRGTLVEGTGVSIAPASKPACGILLVSDGTYWYIVGTFAGNNTTFQSLSESRTQQTAIIFLTSTTDGCSTLTSPGFTTDAAGLYWCKYASTQTTPLVVNSSNYYSVNTNYNRFYRDSNNNRTGYCYIIQNRGGTHFTLPVAMYPSEY